MADSEGRKLQTKCTHGNVQLMIQVNSAHIESIVVFNSINSAMLTDQIIAPHTISHN